MGDFLTRYVLPEGLKLFDRHVSPVLQEMSFSMGGFLLNKAKFLPETMSYSLQCMLQFQECASSLQISGSISEIISADWTYVMTPLTFVVYVIS